jgi:hypothetical protein
MERKVDHNAIRANQIFTILLLALAFIFQWPLLAAITSVIMLVSAIWPKYGLFTFIYRKALVPAGILKPNVIEDNPEPHKFAQGLGGTFVGLGYAFTCETTGLGVPVLGWGLVIVVIALATLNLVAHICVGCLLYYWLNRLGIPGFEKSKVS